VIKDVDREATLKRFAQRGRKNILNPESSNPDHQPYEFSPSEWAKKVEIVGIAVAVLKKVQEN
jgi:SOS-response transcriptional repressor LexA